MRKLPFLALALLPLMTSAQQISLGLNTGAGVSKDYISGGYGSAKVDVHLSRYFMVGGAIDIGNLTREIHASGPNGAYAGTTKSKLLFLSPTFSASAKLNIARSYLYGGLDGGYIAGSIDQYESAVFNDEVYHAPPTKNVLTHGWSMGAHVGFNNHVAGRWSFNAEGGARINTFPTRNTTSGVAVGEREWARRSFGESSYYYPISIGIRYAL